MTGTSGRGTAANAILRIKPASSRGRHKPTASGRTKTFAQKMRAGAAFAALWVFAASANPAETPRVLLDTSMGEIGIELFAVESPVTVAHFLQAVDDRVYDGLIFHRVIADFMIQTGGVRADGTELDESDGIRNEADNSLKNLEGSVAMARFDDIDSASRQFFFNLGDNPHLDHSDKSCTRADQAARAKAAERGLSKPLNCSTFGYTVFAKVIAGMAVVRAISEVPTEETDDHPDLPTTPVIVRSIRRVSSGD